MRDKERRKLEEEIKQENGKETQYDGSQQRKVKNRS